MSWFKKMWEQGKKIDPLTHKAMELTMKIDSKGVREVSKGMAKVTGINAFNSLADEADKNVKDPARGIGRAAVVAGGIFGGMALAGAGAAGAGTAGASAGAAGGAAGGTGLTLGGAGLGMTAGGSGLGMTAAGTAAGGTTTGLASTGLGASGSGATAAGSSWMDWFGNMPSGGGGQQRQLSKWSEIEPLPELDVPQPDATPRSGVLNGYFGGGNGA